MDSVLNLVPLGMTFSSGGVPATYVFPANVTSTDDTTTSTIVITPDEGKSVAISWTLSSFASDPVNGTLTISGGYTSILCHVTTGGPAPINFSSPILFGQDVPVTVTLTNSNPIATALTVGYYFV